MERRCRLIVVAIDFGTTFSTWGYSFKDDYDQNPTKITAKHWTGLQTALSMKGPTTILIEPDGKTVDSFGFDAETKYAELAEDGQHKEWYYFKKFKMQLYDKIGLRRDFTLIDATGKPLQAKTVFSLSIRYLKDDVIDIARQSLGEQLTEQDIHWVLTVPAIWNDVAKQFMREAAEDAGLKTENVTIALEPESASLYCQHLPATKTQNSLRKLPVGSKYIILDAGGGTVDTTVHQIMPDGKLKEIHEATGGDWGGEKVDEAFEKFLCEITGDAVMDEFKDKAMVDYLDLMRNFEVKKREFKTGGNRQTLLKLPAALVNKTENVTGMKMGDKIKLSKYKDKVTFRTDKVVLDHDVMKGFFRNSVENIIKHLDGLFRKRNLEDCKVIVMVGGYSESSVLQESIRSHFQRKYVIIPANAGLAILYGAVIFGHNPSLIAERVCRFSYGTRAAHPKTEDCLHRRTNTIIAEGIELCDNIFNIHVRIGDVVKVGEWQEEMLYHPMYRNQTNGLFEIYCTKEFSPELVTDKGCIKLGEVLLPMLDTRGGREREATASFLFGGTELEVKVYDKTTGTERKISLSFLT